MRVRLWIAVSAMLLCAASLRAQDIRVRALDGRSGRPIAHEHILLWLFDDVSHRGDHSANLQTDENGEALLSAKLVHWSYLQAWVDWHTDCVKTSVNFESLSVEEIRSNGLVNENTCSKNLHVTARPGELVVFARKPTWRERQAW